MLNRCFLSKQVKSWNLISLYIATLSVVQAKAGFHRHSFFYSNTYFKNIHSNKSTPRKVNHRYLALNNLIISFKLFLKLLKFTVCWSCPWILNSNSIEKYHLWKSGKVCVMMYLFNYFIVCYFYRDATRPIEKRFVGANLITGDIYLVFVWIITMTIWLKIKPITSFQPPLLTLGRTNISLRRDRIQRHRTFGRTNRRDSN